jgi:hypothetical protein
MTSQNVDQLSIYVLSSVLHRDLTKITTLTTLMYSMNCKTNLRLDELS